MKNKSVGYEIKELSDGKIVVMLIDNYSNGENRK